MDDLSRARTLIRRWFDAAVDVVDPRRAVMKAISFHDGDLLLDEGVVPLARSGRLVVISIGKAAGGMAQGALDVLGDRIDHGIILTKYGHLQSPVQGFESFEAGHPVPDENSLNSTRTILSAVDGLASDDLVVALISGGGSALLEFPVEGVSLEDMRSTTGLLMHAGAGIHDLNAVRKSLSEVKGGGLRRVIGPARCVSLLLSDVLGNDPTVIASGPTVIAPSDQGEAAEVIDRFGIRTELPKAVIRVIDGQRRSAGGVDTSDDVVSVIADNALFIREMALSAQENGKKVRLDPDPYEGDAATFGRDFVRAIREEADDVDVIVRGGEATVEVMGDGTGGRNTEMSLAAAIEMEGDEVWLVASLASDGDDGNSGAAGAIADGKTVARAADAGVDAGDALRRNDSATFFRAADGLVEIGPTGTNVNDVYIALRRRASTQERDRG